MREQPYYPSDWYETENGITYENPFAPDLTDEEFYQVVQLATKIQKTGISWSESDRIALEKADQILEALTDSTIFAKEYFDRQVNRDRGALFRLKRNPDIIPLAREAAALYRKKCLFSLIAVFARAAGCQTALPHFLLTAGRGGFSGTLNERDSRRLNDIMAFFASYRVSGRGFFDGTRFADPQLKLAEKGKDTPLLIDPRQDEAIESLAETEWQRLASEETFQLFRTYEIFKEEAVTCFALKELSYFLNCVSTRNWDFLKSEEALMEAAGKVGWTYFAMLERKNSVSVPPDIAEEAQKLRLREGAFLLIAGEQPHPNSFKQVFRFKNSDFALTTEQYKVYLLSRQYFIDLARGLHEKSQQLCES
jgi:hypothetical protein